MGELQLEILDTIQDVYDTEYGQGNWVSPLSGMDAVVFVCKPGAMEDEGESGNPLTEEEWGGLSSLYVTMGCNGLEAILSGAPDDGAGRLYGWIANWWNTNIISEASFVMHHEWGHKILRTAFPGGEHPAAAENPVFQIPTEYQCLYGAYDVMRYWYLEGESYPYFNPWEQYYLGWVTPTVVENNRRDVLLTDFRETGACYMIPIREVAVDNGAEAPGTITNHAREYYLVAYHRGNYGFYAPPDDGLMIWHIIDHFADLWYDNPPLWTAGYTKPNLYLSDLELASGLFSDPSESPGYWVLPDSAGGWDTLDNWIDAATGQPRNYPSYLLYRGSNTDLFSPNGATEFSFRSSSNPHSFGYEGWNFPLPPPTPTAMAALRRNDQNVPNSIMIRIKGEQAEGVIVDLLRAPYEDLTYPSGGEVFGLGDPVTITWNHAITEINTVDILYSADGGQTYPTELAIASGVSASAGQYVWTPTADHVTGAARIKVVYHNTLDQINVGEDESDETFSVVAARFVNESAHVGLDYDGTPYAAASFDYDGDGDKDLFVSMKDQQPSKLYTFTNINEHGVPDFQVASNAFALGEEPGWQTGGVSAADFDNDGYLDFLVAAGNSGVLRLYHQDPANPGNFNDWSDEMNIAQYGDDSWAGAWGDYNRDGQIDLYLCRGEANGFDPGSGMGNVTNVILKNDYADSGEFINDNTKQLFNSTASTASGSATWMDIDGDGDLDLFRGDAKGTVSGTGTRLYVNDGVTFQDQISSRVTGGAASVDYISGAKWVDANNDGAPDLVISRNIDGVPQKLLLNDGSGYFGASTAFPLEVASTGLEAWDYDLDGRQDMLFLPAGTNGTPTLYGNRLVGGNPAFVDRTVDGGFAQSVGRVDGSIACDYDGDGDKDIYLGRPISSGAFYYEARAGAGDNDPPANNWVGVRLSQRITTAATQAIGARVVFHLDGETQQVQVVDGGSGRGGQNDFDLICGVGENPGPVSCDITWPSGRVEVGQSLDVGTLTSIVEPNGFELYENSVSATFEVYKTGQQSVLDMIFTWETNFQTDPARDRVLISQALPPCGLSDYELSASDPSVDWNVERVANGHYLHTVRLVGVPCVQGCSYSYTVKSERDQTSHQSQVHSLAISMCAK